MEVEVLKKEMFRRRPGNNSLTDFNICPITVL